MGVNIWGCDDGKMGDASSMEIWWLINIRATLIAIIFITISHFSKKFYVRFLAASTSSSSSSSSSSLLSSALNLPSSSSPNSPSRIPEIVNNSDLEFLIDNLDEKCNEDEKWENVIEKKNNFLSYRAKCCKPKDKPLTYLSTTVFEICSPDLLRDFYMDNDYRKQWDKTVIDHMQLQVDTTTGIEIGRTVKKFPLLTPREYILAWRLWEGKDRSFYCFIKVPPEFDARTGTPFSSISGSVVSDDESRKKKLLRRPSKKFVAKSLLLLGGVMYLFRAHSALGGKFTVAYILRKLRKHGGDSSSQSNPS